MRRSSWAWVVVFGDKLELVELLRFGHGLLKLDLHRGGFGGCGCLENRSGDLLGCLLGRGGFSCDDGQGGGDVHFGQRLWDDGRLAAFVAADAPAGVVVRDSEFLAAFGAVILNHVNVFLSRYE